MHRVFCCLILLGATKFASHALEIGERVGPIELLTLDARPLTMTNYAESRGTVAVFLSSRHGGTSPKMQVLRDLNTRLRLRGILFVAIFPDTEETSDEVRSFVQHGGMLFPAYRDPEGAAVGRLGAKVTPEAFLLDAEGTLIYQGAIGDSKDKGLRRALTEFLDGKSVTVGRLPGTGRPIGRPEPRRAAGDPFGSVAFSSELIFEQIPGAPVHHCSTIAEAANGDLLVVWYGGSYESADDQALYLSRRKKDERVWSRPVVLIRNSAQPPGNAVVFRAIQG